jgi:hypothetical protein
MRARNLGVHALLVETRNRPLRSYMRKEPYVVHGFMTSNLVKYALLLPTFDMTSSECVPPELMQSTMNEPL